MCFCGIEAHHGTALAQSSGKHWGPSPLSTGRGRDRSGIRHTLSSQGRLRAARCRKSSPSGSSWALARELGGALPFRGAGGRRARPMSDDPHLPGRHGGLWFFSLSLSLTS